MEREFRYEVADKYDELLSHATDIEKLEKNLQDTFSSVKAIKVRQFPSYAVSKNE